MSDLSIKIKADVVSAVQQFDELARSSAYLEEKIRKTAESFDTSRTQKFIDDQKLAGAAITATKGELAAITAQTKAYEKEIQSLIKSGISPEDSAVTKLQAELDTLNGRLKDNERQTQAVKQAKKDAAEAAKLYEKSMKSLEKAAIAGAAALAALGTAVAATVQKTAEAGDQYAKNARVIGAGAEAYQELIFAADRSGVSSEALTKAMQKLNVQMGDIKKGTGTATKYLQENNAALLKELKAANDNEAAFTLMMGAINGASNEFEKAGLATALFGKAGQDLIKMADAGVEGIAALREEARKYGVISNEAAAASEAYIDAQTNLKAALAGVGYELSEALMPAFTGALQGAADFISGIDDMEGILKTAATVLASATGCLRLSKESGFDVKSGISRVFCGIYRKAVCNDDCILCNSVRACFDSQAGQAKSKAPAYLALATGR